MNPADRMSVLVSTSIHLLSPWDVQGPGGPGGTAWAWKDASLWAGFHTPRMWFSLSLLIYYYVQSILPVFLEMGGGLQGSWVVLIPPSSPCPFPVLCCGCLSQKNALSLAPLLQPKLDISHGHVNNNNPWLFQNNSCLLFPTDLGWLHSHPFISVWDIHITLLSSGSQEQKKISLWAFV